VTQPLLNNLAKLPRPQARRLLLLICSAAGLLLSLLLHRSYSPEGALTYQFTPGQIEQIATEKIRKLGYDPEHLIVTTTFAQNDRLVLYTEEKAGSARGNQLLRSLVPGYYWEVAFFPAEQGITVLYAGSGAIDRAIAVLRFNQKGEWFYFHRAHSQPGAASIIPEAEALQIAHRFLSANLLEPAAGRAVRAESIGLSSGRWTVVQTLDEIAPGLSPRLVVEIEDKQVSRYALEYDVPESFLRSVRASISLSQLILVLLGISVFLITVLLLVQQLRRDAIDFRLGFCYSAIFSFPAMWSILAQVPSVGNIQLKYGALVAVLFILISLLTWAVAALLLTPPVALIDSLARQLWPEKLAPFDSLLRLHLRARSIWQAVVDGLLFGVASLGALSLIQFLISALGYRAAFNESVVVPAAGSFAFIWILSTNLVSGLATGFFVLALTTLLRLKIERSILLLTSPLAILLPLFFIGDATFSSASGFLLIGLLYNLLLVYIILVSDLVTFIVANATLFSAIAAQALVFSSNPVYFANGLGIFIFLGLTGYIAYRKMSRGEPDLRLDYVPEYIKRLRSRERINRDIEIARQVQIQFLPQQTPRIDGLDIATVCHPAYEVGGDYYDFIELGPSRLGVVIADVAGKGIPAAFYMTMVTGLIQSQALNELPPGEVLKRINRVACRKMGPSTFITLFYTVIDMDRMAITYSNGGHNPQLLISAGGAVRKLGCGGMVLGVRPSSEYEEETIRIEAGDRLILYTDGIVEASNGLNEEFGIERLSDIVKRSAAKTSSALVEKICLAVDSFSEGAPQSDDLTMIVISFGKVNYGYRGAE